MTTLIGTASNQIPTNGDLGTMAFQDSAAISIGSISIGLGIPTIVANATTLSLGTINSTSVGVSTNSTTISIGNTSVNVSINATSFSGTSNNALYFSGNIDAGTF